MEGQIAIVAYKPKESKAEALHQLIREHYPILKSEGVTDRATVMMESKDGTIIGLGKRISARVFNYPLP